MKKKMTVFALTLTVMLSFTTVISANTVQRAVTADSVYMVENMEHPNDVWSHRMSNEYAQIMQNGKYYIRYTGYVFGMKMTAEMATDGRNTDTISEMWGMKTHTLTLDGKEYEIDDKNKTYTVTDLGYNDLWYDEDMTWYSFKDGQYYPDKNGQFYKDEYDDYYYVNRDENGSVNDSEYSNLVYKGNGNGQISSLASMGIDQNSYDYEEFVVASDEDYSYLVQTGEVTQEQVDSLMGTNMRYYYDGGKLYAITVSVMGIETVMIIEELSSTIPSNMLTVPAGYKEAEEINPLGVLFGLW